MKSKYAVWSWVLPVIFLVALSIFILSDPALYSWEQGSYFEGLGAGGLLLGILGIFFGVSVFKDRMKKALSLSVKIQAIIGIVLGVVSCLLGLLYSALATFP